MAGKGDDSRPVDREKWNEGYDRIFRKGKKGAPKKRIAKPSPTEVRRDEVVEQVKQLLGEAVAVELRGELEEQPLIDGWRTVEPTGVYTVTIYTERGRR